MKKGLFLLWLSIAGAAYANDVGTLLGTLETNDHKLQLIVGANETLYNVLDSTGELLAKSLNQTQLGERWPELKELAETGVADGAAVSAEHQTVPALPEASSFIELQ